MIRKFTQSLVFHLNLNSIGNNDQNSTIDLKYTSTDLLMNVWLDEKGLKTNF